MPGLGLMFDPPGENNLIPNPSGEGGTTGWSLSAASWASSSLTTSSTKFLVGEKAFRIQATKDATSTARQVLASTAALPIREGVGYTISAWINVVDGAASGGGAQVLVNFYDASMGFLSQIGTAPNSSTGVIEASASGTAPTGARFAIAFIVHGSNASGDTLDVYFDAVTLAPTKQALNVNDGAKFRAIGFKCPPPPRKATRASSSETEGSRKSSLGYDDRVLTLEARVYGNSDADLAAQLGSLEQKVGKINDEDGTLQVTMPSGATAVFDVTEAEADYTIDNGALANKRAEVTITMTAAPFWRVGALNEIAAEDHAETTLPCVIGVDTAPAGDVPALGRLVIDEDQGQNQWTAIWGIQSENYDPSPNAALFYEAESRTALGSELKAGPTGASGGGSNTLLAANLIPSYQSILSTQAASGGAHLTHVGTYRVFARVQRPTSNSGAVSLALEWAQGDFLNPTTNTEDAKTWAVDEAEGVWTLVDLGLVHLDRVAAGAQRWEGRLLAKSTANGDDIYVDYLMLFPVDEGYGELKISPSSATPTTLIAHDEFDQTEGALAAKTLPLGGTWSGAGDTDDFSIIAAEHVARRAAISDANINTGRYALAGAEEPTNSKVSVTVSSTYDVFYGAGEHFRQGVLLRYVDTNNWLAAYLGDATPGKQLRLFVAKRVAGTVTVLGSVELAGKTDSAITPTTVSLQAGADGSWQAWAGTSDGPPLLSGQDAVLATGGTLQKGKGGIYDVLTSGGTTRTRTFDNFTLFTGIANDAALYASQSLEIRADRVLREDSSGTLMVIRTDYKGSYFRPPPARREARSVRTIVKLARGNIDSGADSAIDDVSYRLYWQPRGLVLAET